MTLCFKNSTEDARIKFEQQSEQFSKLTSEIEKAKLKQNAEHEETLSKVDEASKKASNDVSSANDHLERLVKKTKTEIIERIATLKESMNKIDVSVECLESKQKKCDGLVSANRGLLDKMSEEIGKQLQELKESDFNNGRDRQNIKEQIVQMQTRSDQENNLTKRNIQVTSSYDSVVSYILCCS